MGKIVETRELYKDTINDITKSEDNWLSFLKTASWNFKYSFNDQILIFAQRPNATACAEMEEWNEKVHRWVNKDADYIFVFSKNENSKYPFRLVFDVADTHNYKNTPYKLWSIKQEYESEIIDSLEAKFGDISENSSFVDAIITTANNMVMDNIQDYMSSILKYKTGTMLESLSDSEIQSLVYQTTFGSVAYMMLNRCGIDPEKYIAKSEFSYIKKFDNSNLTVLLGTAISDIAEIGLREIAKTVINLQKNEKNQNRTFVNNEKEEYSNSKEKIKGGIEDDRTRIHESRGLQYAQPNNETRKITNREIRNNEVTLSKEEQERRIYDTTNERTISETSNRNTRNGNENGNTDNRENGETRWDNRRIESERPNDLGKSNEQLQTNSRRTSNERTNLYLGYYDINNNSNIKEFKDDETVNKIIENAPNIIKDFEKVEQFFKKNIDNREKLEEYIIKILGNAYTEYEIDNVRTGYKCYQNGLYLWKGNYLNRTEECFKNWNDITENFISILSVKELENNFNLLTENEQKQNIAEAENASVFSFTQEMIDSVLQEGSGFAEGKFRIYEQFTKSLSSQENADFLKNEYGTGGRSADGNGVCEEYSSKGIVLSFAHKENAPKLRLTWIQVEKRIRELISAERYLTDIEKDEYYDWVDANDRPKISTELENQIKDEEYKLAERLHSFIKDYDLYAYMDNVPPENTDEDNIELIRADINDELNIRDYIDFLKASYEDEDYDSELAVEARELLAELEKRLPYYEYEVGDVVYIGTRQFSISSIDTNRVALRDMSFPILVEEMDRNEFDRKVKENPGNDKVRTRRKVQDIIENTLIEDIEENKEDSSFDEWLDTFIEEKGIDLDEIFSIESNGEIHYFELGNVIENIKATSKEEQEEIRKMIVKIDFHNADVVDYFKHLAQALVENYQEERNKGVQEDDKVEENAPEKLEQTEKKLMPHIKRKRRNKIEYFDLHPEIPLKDRNNYKITDNGLGEGTQKEKYKRNIEAIKILKKCEDENRYATTEEQEILAQYVGWGGLADAFNKTKDNWSEEYKELLSLLTEKEYEKARASTLTSFYTPPIVINAIYEALEKMGLKQGNILEPSCRSWQLYGNVTR